MRLRHSLLAAGVLLLGACYDKGEPAAPRPTFSVTPTPTSVDVRVDSLSAVPLTAAVKNAQGQNIADAPVSFVSEDATIASVYFNATTGQYYAVGRQAGTTRIRVTSGINTPAAYIDVTVRPRPVERVDLTPATATINSGSTVQLTARLITATGDTVKPLIVVRDPTVPLADTVMRRVATFSSADAAVASVSSTGRVTGLKGGTARIIATYKNTSKAATPAPADTATVADTSIITVNQSLVASIVVTPSTAQIAPKGNVTLRYTYRGANNVTTTGGAPTVVSSDPTVATVGTIDPVAQTVVITGVKVGDATITFSFLPAGATVPVTQTALIAVR